MKHPCEMEDWIPLKELWFRLNIYKSGWEHHVDTMGRVPSELVVRVASGRVIDGVKYPKGEYVKWKLAAELLIANFQDAQLEHTYIRLKALGFTRDLKIASPKRGIARFMTSVDINDWRACVKEEKGMQDTIPRSFKQGNIGKWSYQDGGLLDKNEMQVMQIESKPTAKAIDNVKKEIAAINMDDGVDLEALLGDISTVDFGDAEEVATIQRKAKFLKEFTAAQKEMVALAKISNASIDINEVEKLLEAVMVAFRSTIDQMVPKTTKEIYGAIVTELVRSNPSIQKHLNKIDEVDLANKVRAIFTNASSELASICRAFSEKEE